MNSLWRTGVLLQSVYVSQSVFRRWHRPLRWQSSSYFTVLVELAEPSLNSLQFSDNCS